MIFGPTKLDGVWMIDLERREDERGYFARSFCDDEFAKHGLPLSYPQCNLSFNRLRGTLRGLHYQDDPHSEGKLVRCTRGAIYDVAVDLRPGSPTLCRWIGVELSPVNGRAVFIPKGVAHGFQTLTDDSDVFYQMTEPYDPALARGLRWNDPAFAIGWPLPDPTLSPRDAAFADFVP
jgi:dTDP-4-dehydrorhamnose 3,5-epimerase